MFSLLEELWLLAWLENWVSERNKEPRVFFKTKRILLDPERMLGIFVNRLGRVKTELFAAILLKMITIRAKNSRANCLSQVRFPHFVLQSWIGTYLAIFNFDQFWRLFYNYNGLNVNNIFDKQYIQLSTYHSKAYASISPNIENMFKFTWALDHKGRKNVE